MTDGENLKDLLGKIFTVNLRMRPGERVLVFTDLIAEGEAPGGLERKRRDGLVRLARVAAEAAKGLGFAAIYGEFPALGSHGTEPGEWLWEAAFGGPAASALRASGLLSAIREKRASGADMDRARAVVVGLRADAVDAVVALSNYSTSHTRFRDLLTGAAGTRYASMPLFEEGMLTGSMSADWEEIKRRSLLVSDEINAGETIRVTTAAGTDITFGIKGRTALADTGVLDEPGSFGNLPAGEVYIAPVEGTAEGLLVLEWAPNRRLESPLRVVVSGGLAVEVAGDEPYAETLRADLEKAPGNRNLAELGIGTNDKATRPDNILESEKILGTVHMAFGDNSSMGGKVSTPFHQDFVFFGPTLEVINKGGKKAVISEGRLRLGTGG